MSDTKPKTVTVMFTEEQATTARELLSNSNRHDIADMVEYGLAAHRRSERDRRLGLPWRSGGNCVYTQVGAWVVGSVASESTYETRVAVARLMAAAPDLARAVEGLLKSCESGYPKLGAAREALAESGWIAGEE